MERGFFKIIKVLFVHQTFLINHIIVFVYESLVGKPIIQNHCDVSSIHFIASITGFVHSDFCI